MRTRTIILAGLLAIVLALSVCLFLIAHPPSEPQPRPAHEKMRRTGWSIQKLSPEEEAEKHRLALVALREAIGQQETKVRALREAAASTNAAPAELQELEEQERILVLIKERLEEEESANKPGGR